LLIVVAFSGTRRFFSDLTMLFVQYISAFNVLIETDSLNLQWLYSLVITTGLSWVCYLERSKVVWLSILDVVLLQNVTDPVI